MKKFIILSLLCVAGIVHPSAPLKNVLSIAIRSFATKTDAKVVTTVLDPRLEIYTAGLDKKEVLRALFKAARLSSGFVCQVTSLKYYIERKVQGCDPDHLTDAQVDALFKDGRACLDYVNGREMKCVINNSTVWIGKYNHCNGEGLAQKVIAELRKRESQAIAPAVKIIDVSSEKDK